MRTLVSLLLLLLVSCTTEVDIFEEHPSVPVVYAMINPFDSIQTVRVHRTFIINKKSDWNTLNVDSLVYQNVEVNISGKKNDRIKWTEILEKTVIDRDSGFFPSKGFQIYRLNHPLPINLSKPPEGYNLGKPDIDSLVLEVHVPDQNLTTRAAAPVLEPFRMAMMPAGPTIYLYNEKTTFFVLPGGGEDCDPSRDFCYGQIEFRVHYKDYLENTVEEQEIHWITHEGWEFETLEYPMTPERIFNRMKLLIPDREEVITRRLDSIDVQIIVPSKCFSDWWDVKDYWDMSDNPPFTNFDHSYGLFFTYKIGKKTGLILESRAMDTLCQGYLYKKLKFKNW